MPALLILLILPILFSIAACDGENGANPSATAGAAGSGMSGSASGGDTNTVSTLSYSCMTEANSMSALGLAELRAYDRNVKTSGQQTAVDNHYFNKYYLPYLTLLAKEQKTTAKSTVSSEWFTKKNQSMYYLAEDSTYSNIYKKMAQDMYTRMLPDPDVIFEQVSKLAESNGFILDKSCGGFINKAETLYELEREATALSYVKYITDYYGESYWFYDASGDRDSYIVLSFISPRYNLFGVINDYLYDWKTIPEGAFTVEPMTDTTVTLDELRELRARSEREFCIQSIYVSLHNGGMISRDRQNELLLALMDIVQPYCETNSGRLADMLEKGTEENRYKFDKYLEYFMNRDYSQKAISRPDIPDDYFVTVEDAAVYGTCDTYIDILATDYYNTDKNEGSAGIYINCGGNEIMPAYRVKEHGSSEVMGVYYTLLMPVYYNDAVINGFFEPYTIPEKRSEYEITITPDYSSGVYSSSAPYVPLDISAEGEAEGLSPTYLFTHGLGEAAHSSSWHEREKMDISSLGYTQNPDGTWDRSIASRVEGASSTLTYDDTGLLIGGKTIYSDLSFKDVEYKTDENGNAVMSVDKLYDKDGKLIDQAITEYSGETRTTAHYETAIRDGRQNYIKTDTECRDAQGVLINRTEYNENGSPNNETIVSSREEMISGTAGDSRIKTIRTVTYVTYDENGNMTGNHTVDVPMPENEEPKHALQKYLEEHTGIRRD